jgi:hypothetical protein
MAGPWKIEGLPNARFTCWQKMEWSAKQMAKKFGRPVKVTYHGKPTRGPVNTHRDRSSFMIDAHGRKNFKIDPTWWENHRKKG